MDLAWAVSRLTRVALIPSPAFWAAIQVNLHTGHVELYRFIYSLARGWIRYALICNCSLRLKLHLNAELFVGGGCRGLASV